MKQNFKGCATKTMIASAVASMMVGAAFAAPVGWEAQPSDVETVKVTKSETIYENKTEDLTGNFAYEAAADVTGTVNFFSASNNNLFKGNAWLSSLTTSTGKDVVGIKGLFASNGNQITNQGRIYIKATKEAFWRSQGMFAMDGTIVNDKDGVIVTDNAYGMAAGNGEGVVSGSNTLTNKGTIYVNGGAGMELGTGIETTGTNSGTIIANPSSAEGVDSIGVLFGMSNGQTAEFENTGIIDASNGTHAIKVDSGSANINLTKGTVKGAIQIGGKTNSTVKDVNLTINEAAAVEGDLTIYDGTLNLTGTLHGNLISLGGTTDIQDTTAVDSLVVGRQASGTDDNAVQAAAGNISVTGQLATQTASVLNGTLTVENKATLAADKIAIASSGATLTVNGTLETTSDQIYTVADDKASLTTGLTVGNNGHLLLTDETFTSSVWENLKTALGTNGTFTFDTATYVATGENEVINYETLNKYQRLGKAVVVKNAAAKDTEAVLDKLTAGKDYTLGAFDFKVAADAEGTDKWNLTVGDTDNGTAIFRGAADGEVFMNAGDATITLNNVKFGQEDADRGNVSNTVKLGTNTTVEAGSFTFNEVNLNGKTFTAEKGAELTVASVTKDSTGTTIANGGKVTYVGTIDPDTKTLTVYGATTVQNGGTFIVGSTGGEVREGTNTYYIGQKTVFNNDLNFGTGSDASKNLIVVDMQSVANIGFDAKTDSILTANDVHTYGTSQAVTVELVNLDKRLTSIKTDANGLNTYTLKLGKLGSLTPEVNLEGQDSIFGDKWKVTTSADAGITATIAMDTAASTSAYSSLSQHQSGIAAQMISEMNNFTSGTNDLTRALWNLSEADAAKLLGEKATEADLAAQALDSADDVSLGAIESGAFSASVDYVNEVAKTLNRRNSIANLNTERNPNGLTAWVDVFGSANEAKSLFGDSDGHYGYESDIYGAMLGFDWVAPCGAIVGAAINVGSADSNSVGDFSTKSDADSDYYGISLYGSHRIGNFNGTVDFGYIHSKNDITTKTFFGSFGESLDADIFTFGLGAEYLAKAGAVNVVPHAGIRWSRIDMDDSAFGADYDAMNLFQMPMGVTFSGTIETAGMKVAPMLDISVVPAFGDKDAVATFTGNIKDTTRVVDTNPVQMTLGVNAQVDAWTFGVNYGLTAGGDDRLNNSFNLNARYTF